MLRWISCNIFKEWINNENILDKLKNPQKIKRETVLNGLVMYKIAHESNSGKRDSIKNRIILKRAKLNKIW